MTPLAKAAVERGYHGVLLPYQSTTRDLESLGHDLLRTFSLMSAQKINFITHSMGALVVRVAMTLKPDFNVGRVVMLGPPNQGSEIADLLSPWWPYKRLFGPAGMELGTKRSKRLASLLGPPTFECGIIAGTRAIDPIGWVMLPKPNDGRVSVASTRIEGAAHLTLPVTHPFMMNDETVIRQSLAFIQNGKFE